MLQTRRASLAGGCDVLWRAAGAVRHPARHGALAAPAPMLQLCSLEPGLTRSSVAHALPLRRPLCQAWVRPGSPLTHRRLLPSACAPAAALSCPCCLAGLRQLAHGLRCADLCAGGQTAAAASRGAWAAPECHRAEGEACCADDVSIAEELEALEERQPAKRGRVVMSAEDLPEVQAAPPAQPACAHTAGRQTQMQAPHVCSCVPQGTAMQRLQRTARADGQPDD